MHGRWSLEGYKIKKGAKLRVEWDGIKKLISYSILDIINISLMKTILFKWVFENNIKTGEKNLIKIIVQEYIIA